MDRGAHVNFYKYHGCGNDFVMINNLTSVHKEFSNIDFNKRMCDRRYGIGADGIIVIARREDYDFEMIYYNSDGKLSTMCGNGARCSLAFTRHLGMYSGRQTVRFLAPDGPHVGSCVDESLHIYRTQMRDVARVDTAGDSYFVDTGSPHYVTFVEDLSTVDVSSAGREIRNRPEYRGIGGVNVNFVHYDQSDGTAHVRTYERGVEDETLACGTGAVAVAIATESRFPTPPERTEKEHDTCLASNTTLGRVVERTIRAVGGELSVCFTIEKQSDFITDIFLTGPAFSVFNGTYFP